MRQKIIGLYQKVSKRVENNMRYVLEGARKDEFLNLYHSDDSSVLSYYCGHTTVVNAITRLLLRITVIITEDGDMPNCRVIVNGVARSLLKEWLAQIVVRKQRWTLINANKPTQYWGATKNELHTTELAKKVTRKISLSGCTMLHLYSLR